MKKISLPLVLSLVVLAGFFVVKASAASINLNEIINTSQANGSPLGDCIGPDGKHFQATNEVCLALNKAWGKSGGFQGAGTASTTVTPIADALKAGGPTGDCIGPDGKHFQATSTVCYALNHAWGKPNHFQGAGTASTSVITIATALESGGPTGDCIGPDGKHFQATSAVCYALNHAWGKPNHFQGAGTQSSQQEVSVTQNNTNGSPLGNCVGPDKKLFQTTVAACITLNKAWGNNSPSFTPGVTTTTGGNGSNGTNTSGGNQGSSVNSSNHGSNAASAGGTNGSTHANSGNNGNASSNPSSTVSNSNANAANNGSDKSNGKNNK